MCRDPFDVTLLCAKCTHEESGWLVSADELALLLLEVEPGKGTPCNTAYRPSRIFVQWVVSDYFILAKISKFYPLNKANISSIGKKTCFFGTILH